LTIAGHGALAAYVLIMPALPNYYISEFFQQGRGSDPYKSESISTYYFIVITITDAHSSITTHTCMHSEMLTLHPSGVHGTFLGVLATSFSDLAQRQNNYVWRLAKNIKTCWKVKYTSPDRISVQQNTVVSIT
jgi:hypothetical protein